jgi:hypothetical protein
MALEHSTATRNGIAEHVTDQLDSGSLVIQTAGSVTIATLPFAATAFGAASGGEVAISGAISDTNAAGNASAAARASFRNSGGTEIMFCTVTQGGVDISLSSTTIGSGDTVTINTLTYTAPA